MEYTLYSTVQIQIVMEILNNFQQTNSEINSFSTSEIQNMTEATRC